MNATQNGHSLNLRPTVVRTERGLTVGGSRLTIYQLMDHLKAGQSPAEVRDLHRMTIKQMEDVLQYIEDNREQVEAEYQQVLELAEENRRYWEEYNRERFERIRKEGPKPRNPEAWQRFQEMKLERRKARSQS